MNQQQMTNISASTTVARIHDEWFSQIPDDLYIPPEAFQILLEYFEGPLDFLLYLVHRNGLNLVELDIAPIATQYLHYIQGMNALNIELAADYMVMAASLADIKSRLLLPKPQIAKPEDDPRQNLLSRLQNYARVKQGAMWLGSCQVLERDVFSANSTVAAVYTNDDIRFDVSLLHEAMNILLQRPRLQTHQVEVEPVQLEERMAFIRNRAMQGGVIAFDHLINPAQGHMGIVVTFMAVLELVRQGELEIRGCGIEQPLALEGRQSHAA
jgi:segregation and condensation protein A